MTNKIVTAYIDEGLEFESFEEAHSYFESTGEVEGFAYDPIKTPKGLTLNPEYGFEAENALVHRVTIRYTVTDEYVFSVISREEEEQDNGNDGHEDGDLVRPSEPESDSRLDEGVEPTEPTAPGDEEPELGS